MSNDFFLTEWFFLGMRWLYYNVGLENVFITILLSTIVLKALTLISDVKSRKSTMKMAVIQPELERLQKKYGNDRAKFQKAQSKLMRDNNVSMWSSCLPVLITMPLFFCFIAAFRFWGMEQMVRAILETYETGSTKTFESFRWLWVNNIWQADNGTLPVVATAKSFLGTKNLQNLIYFRENPAALETFKSLGFIVSDVKNIPEDVIARYNEIVQPMANLYTGHNNGWFVLPVLAAGTNLLSSLLMQKSQPMQAGGGTGKAMLYMFPVMSFMFCLTSNAAFAIYWTISSALTTIVNLILSKKYPRPNFPAGTKENAK